jgi:hypothetical protein
MSRKHILTISLLLPFMAMSNLAHAGPQGSDRAWYPNWGRSDSTSNAYVTRPAALDTEAAPQTSGGKATCRYQGGRSMTCSR